MDENDPILDSSVNSRWEIYVFQGNFFVRFMRPDFLYIYLLNDGSFFWHINVSYADFKRDKEIFYSYQELFPSRKYEENKEINSNIESDKFHFRSKRQALMMLKKSLKEAKARIIFNIEEKERLFFSEDLPQLGSFHV